MTNINIGWPEAIILIIMFLNVCIDASKNGQPRTDKHNLGLRLFGVAVSLVLLVWGGFFA